jgi:hypothetical protein
MKNDTHAMYCQPWSFPPFLKSAYAHQGRAIILKIVSELGRFGFEMLIVVLPPNLRLQLH